jgi:uncharacterized protein (DUF58 family)
MDFDGGQPATHKRDYAATLLAALAFLLLGQGDATGLLRLGAGVRDAVPARARPGQLDAILALLGAPESTGGRTDLKAALEDVSERVGRRGLVVLASDLLDLAPTALEPLTRLRTLGHDVIVFQVMHALELDFTYDERLRFIDPENLETLDSDPEAVRKEYLAEIDAFVAGCRKRCMSAGARYVLARTDVPVQEVVAEALSIKIRRAWA